MGWDEMAKDEIGSGGMGWRMEWGGKGRDDAGWGGSSTPLGRQRRRRVPSKARVVSYSQCSARVPLSKFSTKA